MSSHGVLDEFDREEISVKSDVRPPGYKDMLKTLFVSRSKERVRGTVGGSEAA